ncbi:alcohol dehydrogenase class IV [Litorivivens lipolytica]|uniref:Alcohol dehydrogenase class IV n=2 Tax=Litorivivens lipolytica TaxID=1524264 RepID=A0A7W4W510_9GAMM|nr:alcohol dehydrogenase class IV [Litorivivens lipolytica]
MKFISVPAPLVYAGAGSSSALMQAIGNFGHQRVLVVTDKMLVELGLVKQVTASLAEQGIDTVIYDGVLPDPDFGQVNAGIASCKQNRCDAVLAIGGGSALDAAKVIAICSGSDQEPANIVGYFNVKSRGLPIYCVPTTAGTGSEATMVSVVTDAQAETKCFIVDPKLVPDAVALDADLMLKLPAPITAATGMDALTHAIESALSREASEDTLRKSLAAARIIFQNLESAVADGGNRSAREAMALASYYAGSAFTIANVGYVHGMAHQLGALCHLPHGLANALFLPHVLDFYRDTCAPQMARISKSAGIGSANDSDDILAEKLVERVKELSQAIGIPTHADVLKPDQVATIAARAMKESHGLYGYPVPKYMRGEECEAIVRKILPVGE